MGKLNELKEHLTPGNVYRRQDLVKWSKSIDRHLELLTEEGTLQKVSQGVYYYPKETAFGQAPPSEEVLVGAFLKDNRFLLTSPNAYNRLGVGTTQLYNKRVVYNHKRHGEFKLGKRVFSFRIKHHFPKELDPEFLLVDLVNELQELAEDKDKVLKNVLAKAKTMDKNKLAYSVVSYGNSRTKKVFDQIFTGSNGH